MLAVLGGHTDDETRRGQVVDPFDADVQRDDGIRVANVPIGDRRPVEPPVEYAAQTDARMTHHQAGTAVQRHELTVRPIRVQCLPLARERAGQVGHLQYGRGGEYIRPGLRLAYVALAHQVE